MMGLSDFVEKTTSAAKSAATAVTDKYDLHIRKRAIEEVAKKLKAANLSPSDIDADDYEAMVSDAAKDIRSTYSKRAAQAGFSLLGLDLIFGL